MEKLLRGVLKFNQEVSETDRELLSRLAREGQKPSKLFVTCADSRIDPGLITQSRPGELFVIRNVGNIVPVCDGTDDSVGAAVGFVLKMFANSITTLVVCGHSECGAMKALATSEDVSSMPHLAEWLSNNTSKEEREEDAKIPLRFSQRLPDYDLLSQQNVLAQVDNLTTYPEVRQRVEKGTLHLVGLWFDIGRAEVQVYDPAQKQFVVVDEDLIKTHFSGGAALHAVAA